MIKLEKKESIYFLTMDAGENRWNTTFVREIAKALDTIEDDEGQGALITSSTDSKFFSNGLDLEWMQAPSDHPDGGDREVRERAARKSKRELGKMEESRDGSGGGVEECGEGKSAGGDGVRSASNFTSVLGGTKEDAFFVQGCTC